MLLSDPSIPQNPFHSMAATVIAGSCLPGLQTRKTFQNPRGRIAARWEMDIHSPWILPCGPFKSSARPSPLCCICLHVVEVIATAGWSLAPLTPTGSIRPSQRPHLMGSSSILSQSTRCACSRHSFSDVASSCGLLPSRLTLLASPFCYP